MKKLLLLSALLVFVQTKTQGSKFPEMTDAQKSELEGIKSIMPKYLVLIQLRSDFLGKTYSSVTREESSQGKIKRRKITFELGDTGKVVFYDGEADSYDALTRMLNEDCQDTNMFTGELNPANVNACTALRDMLKEAGAHEDRFDFAILNAVVNRQVNS